MREIKFRAWDNKNKHWLMGYELPNLGGFSLTGESVLFGQWGHAFDKFIFSRDGLSPDDLIIMQFTGLTDKNGNEIYEWDFLKVDEHFCVGGGKWTEQMTIVTFEGGCFVHRSDKGFYSLLSNNISQIEVIGNFHENPELLKGGSNV